MLQELYLRPLCTCPWGRGCINVSVLFPRTDSKKYKLQASLAEYGYFFCLDGNVKENMHMYRSYLSSIPFTHTFISLINYINTNYKLLYQIATRYGSSIETLILNPFNNDLSSNFKSPLYWLIDMGTDFIFLNEKKTTKKHKHTVKTIFLYIYTIIRFHM